MPSQRLNLLIIKLRLSDRFFPFAILSCIAAVLPHLLEAASYRGGVNQKVKLNLLPVHLSVKIHNAAFRAAKPHAAKHMQHTYRFLHIFHFKISPASSVMLLS